MSPESIVGVAFAVLGLAIGSYLNVVIFRLPRELSTVLPRSRCPRCRALIKPWDNVPVLSYLLLRGRCRVCGAPISWRYPLVEAATATCFYLSFRELGTVRDAALAAAFCAAMITLAMIDLDHYILPDVITLPGIVAGLALQLWVEWLPFREAVIGVVVGAALPAAIRWGWYLWRGVHGMGLGDVKMLAMIGAFVGWKGVLATLALASLAGSVAGAVLMFRRRLDLGSRLPFGFFLGFAAIVVLLYGGELFASYLELSGLAALPSYGGSGALP